MEGPQGGNIEARVSAYAADGRHTRSWLSLAGARGIRADCGLLVPNDGGAGHPAILVMAGRAMGKRAVDFVTDVRGVIVAALDYGYEPRERYTVLEFLRDLPAMRRAALAVVPAALLVLEYLRRRPDVDPARIVLLGFSFGAPLVPCITAIDGRVALAGLICGGGDLRTLIAHNVTRSRGPVLGQLAGLVSAALLHPVDPMRYVAKVAPTPLLMVNGLQDDVIPTRNAAILFGRAREPKKIVWVDAGHITPKDPDLTRRVTRVVRNELFAFGLLDGTNLA